MFKLLVIMFVSINIMFANQKVVLTNKFYKDKIYFGSFENGKMNGNGKIYDEKTNELFIDGFFKNDYLVNGKIYSKSKFKHEITSDSKNNNNVFVEKTISGNFSTNKNIKNFYEVLNGDLNVEFKFINTIKYDNLKGKLIVYPNREEMFVDGQLNIKNSEINYIKTFFDYDDLEFNRNKEIEIKGNDFVLKGIIKSGRNINNFEVECVIEWEDGFEYFLTNYKFNKNFMKSINHFKELATKKEVNVLKNDKSNKLESEKLIYNKKEININTSNVEYKNKQLYNNKTEILDLEK